MISIKQFCIDHSILNIDKTSSVLIDDELVNGITATQKAHKSYQRNVVWDDTRKRLFISSIIEDMAYSPIIIVDIESCIKHCISKADETSSLEKFQSLHDEGIRWLSIDGQNRSQAIGDFVNNRVSISGTYKLGRKPSNFEDTYFKDFDDLQQVTFLNKTVNVTIVKNKTFDDLKEMFTRLNSGVALNRQEIRNASSSPLAEWSRKIVSEKSELCNLLFSDSEILRMEDRSEFSKVAMYFHDKTIDSTEDSLDEFYSKGEKTSSLSKSYSEDNLERAENILSLIENSRRANQGSMKGKVFWMFLMYLDSIHDTKEVSNPCGLRVEIDKRIQALCSQSRKELASELQKYENGQRSDKPRTGDYFHSQLSHLNVSKIRKKAFDHFINGFTTTHVKAKLKIA